MATIQTFKGVVRLTKAQLNTLITTGSLSDGTTTITYDPETTIYLTPQEQASTNDAGVILIATDQDVQTGTNTTKAVTPAQLKTLMNELSDTQQDVADNMTDIANLQTADGQNVKITGNQSISGTKNFTGTFQIGGGTISYDSSTDTFSI